MTTRRIQDCIAAILIVALCMLMGAPQAQAQSLYGSILGTVTDASGASVPGATVKVVRVETNQARQATTSETGAYNFPTLLSGTYTVTVAQQGFETFIQKEVAVTVNNAARVDASLKVGSMAESVQVSAQAVSLQTDKGEVRTEIATKDLDEVPVPVNRSYQNLLVTVPGVSPPSSSGSLASNPTRGQQFSVNGTTNGSNSTRIEGANAINSWMSHLSGYVPALEAIETVTVVTSSMDADQGLAGGASINVQLKSGSNQLHGSLFEYHQDNQLKAKPWILPAGQRKPKNIDNQLGGTFGGPIKKDKLFYFGSYDGQFVRQNAAQNTTVPTSDIRAGVMTASSSEIFDPLTGNADGSGRTPFPGKAIPTDRLDSTAQKIQQLFPLPNQPGLTNNYYASGAYSVNRHKFDGKINWNATNKMTVTGRLGVFKYAAFNPGLFGDNGAGVSSAAARDGNLGGTVFSYTVSGTYVFGPRFIVDAYYGYNRLNTFAYPVSMDKGNLGQSLYNLPGTNGSSRFFGGYPSFSISNYTAFGKYADSPVIYTGPASDYVANASWTKSNHAIRFGVDFMNIANNNYELSTNGGSFSFGGGPTILKATGAASANQFNSYATFLLGLTTGATNNYMKDDVRATSRQKAISLYVRDQWQVTRNLTASIGVRWDYLPFGRGANRGFQIFDWENNAMLLCGLGSTPVDCGVTVPKTDFSPRLGIAWRVRPTFVVRTGFGINFDPNPLAWVRDFVGAAEQQASASWPAAPNSYTATSKLKDGIPAVVFPDISSGVIKPYPATQSFYVPQKNYKMGYIESWNFSVQKELPLRFMAQAGYVGTRQIKQLQAMNLNIGTVGGGTASLALNVKYGRTAGSNIMTNYGRNSYDGLQTRLSRSFANGLSLNAAYTFSKAMGLCCDTLSDKNPAIQIPQYRNLNKAFWGANRTQMFTMSWVYQMPFGSGKKWATGGVGRAILGGWQVQGLWAMYSGSPFSVSADGTSLNASGNTQRANQVKANVAMPHGTGVGQSWFDPLAFAQVTTAAFGTAGFNSLFGPGVVNFDTGLSREFRVREKYQIQFRADAFNLCNTPHFSNPSANVSNMTLNSDGTIKNLNGYSTITSVQGGMGREGIDERMFRLGLRLRF
jgi:hypothetical protein